MDLCRTTRVLQQTALVTFRALFLAVATTFEEKSPDRSWNTETISKVRQCCKCKWSLSIHISQIAALTLPFPQAFHARIKAMQVVLVAAPKLFALELTSFHVILTSHYTWHPLQASSLVRSLTDFNFIMTFNVVHHVMGFLHALTVQQQDSEQDLCHGYSQVCSASKYRWSFLVLEVETTIYTGISVSKSTLLTFLTNQ